MTEPLGAARVRTRAAMLDLGGGGAGAAEIAGALGWTRRRLGAAADGGGDVAETLEQARDAELAWWEGRARVGVAGRPNAALWGRAMAGRFAREGYGRMGERDEPVEPPQREDQTRERAKAVLHLLAKARAAAGAAGG